MSFSIKGNKAIINTRSNVYFISLRDILFVERVNQSTIIHTRENFYKLRDSLKWIHKLFPKQFIRSNKSYIINSNKIQELKIYNVNTYLAVFEGTSKTALVNKKELSYLLNKMELT